MLDQMTERKEDSLGRPFFVTVRAAVTVTAGGATVRTPTVTVTAGAVSVTVETPTVIVTADWVMVTVPTVTVSVTVMGPL